MSEETPLDRPLEIYGVFDERQTARLRQYVADMEELVSSSFFKNPGGKVTIRWSAEEPALRTELPYAGEEAVRAVVPIFRQIYNAKEPTSFRQILGILQRNVHERDSALRGEAIAALRDFKKYEREFLKGPGAIKLVTDDGVLTPEILIDLFLHGHYLHKGNEKSEKLAGWPLADITRHDFFTAILGLCGLYWTLANVVRRVLDQPELLTNRR